MGLLEHKCDSCDQVTDILFPLAIVKEMPTGGTQMVQVWYCIACWKVIIEAMEDLEDDENDEEDGPGISLREYRCGCIFKRIGKSVGKGMLWGTEIVCADHWNSPDVKREVYPCGCVIKHIILFFYEYERICEEHLKE